MTQPVPLDGPQSAPTDWSRHDVPTLWAMVATEDAAKTWSQVWAWWRTRDALDAYRRQLVACRDGLAAKWPPQRSEAASAFINHLDAMIDTVSTTADAAAANASAAGSIADALSGARRELQPLYEEWQRNAQIQSDAATVTSVDSWGASSGSLPSLSPAWQEDLNARAHAAVARAERAVFDHTPQLTTAPRQLRNTIQPLRDTGDGDTKANRGTNSSGPQPPLIPPLSDPPTPLSTAGVAGILLTGQPAEAPSAAASIPPVGHETPASGGSWFVSTPLGRALAPGAVIGRNPAVPGPDGGPREGPIGRRGPVPGGPAAGALDVHESGRAPGGPQRPLPEDRTHGQRSVGVGGAYYPAMGTGVAPVGASNTSTRRANPPGKVIGGSRSSQATYTTATGHTVAVSGLNEQPATPPRRPIPPSDPGDPWQIPKGGRPVLEPGPEPYHDPGPGVIGIDR